jgi:hypothetical protein
MRYADNETDINKNDTTQWCRETTEIQFHDSKQDAPRYARGTRNSQILILLSGVRRLVFTLPQYRVRSITSIVDLAQYSHLVNTSHQIERSEDDLPWQINGVPQVLVVNTESYCIPPQRSNVMGMTHKYLRCLSMLSIWQAVQRQLVQFWTGGEGGMDFRGANRRKESRRQGWQEGMEQTSYVMCIEVLMESLESLRRRNC